MTTAKHIEITFCHSLVIEEKPLQMCHLRIDRIIDWMCHYKIKSNKAL